MKKSERKEIFSYHFRKLAIGKVLYQLPYHWFYKTIRDFTTDGKYCFYDLSFYSYACCDKIIHYEFPVITRSATSNTKCVTETVIRNSYIRENNPVRRTVRGIVIMDARVRCDYKFILVRFFRQRMWINVSVARNYKAKRSRGEKDCEAINELIRGVDTTMVMPVFNSERNNDVARSV